MKPRTSIYDFIFLPSGYGHYKVTYITLYKAKNVIAGLSYEYIHHIYSMRHVRFKSTFA